jgi:hypothetical protein
MIDIIRVWNRENDLAKKDQSGYNTADEFNNRVDSVQLELIEKILPYIKVTDRAADILGPFIKTTELVTTPQGVLTPPADYLNYLALSYKYTNTDNSITYIPLNELGPDEAEANARNSIRKADPTKGRVQYYRENGAITITTNSLSTVRVRYLIRPPVSTIVFTVQSNANGTFQTYDSVNSVSLIWPDSAFNLIVYLMLEKLGVEIREQFLIEFAQVLGIQPEMVKKID